MSDIMWFDKNPGDQSLVNEEEQAELVGDLTPTVVRLPENLGGQVVKVLKSFVAPCPKHGTPCCHLELEGGIFVAESDQFYWYQRREQ